MIWSLSRVYANNMTHLHRHFSASSLSPEDDIVSQVINLTTHCVLLSSRLLIYLAVLLVFMCILNIYTAAMCTVLVTCQDSFPLVSRINFLPLWKDFLKRKKDLKVHTKKLFTTSSCLSSKHTLQILCALVDVLNNISSFFG